MTGEIKRTLLEQLDAAFAALDAFEESMIAVGEIADSDFVGKILDSADVIRGYLNDYTTGVESEQITGKSEMY